MTTVIYQIREHHRSAITCRAMLDGVHAAGGAATVKFEDTWRGEIDESIVFYGLDGNTPAIFEQHIAAGKTAIYIDLGYWGRREGGRFSGFHKLVRNARHPTAYFERAHKTPGRFARFDIEVAPWQKKKPGAVILLAGMGDKGAAAEGYKPEEWERLAIAEIQKHTDRPILYRPKPSWKEARPITGVGFSPPSRDVALELQFCHAVVTHHSNVAVDALVAGVPVVGLCGGVAQRFSSPIAQIETPARPDGREQWCADLAWCQWNVAEMRNGRAWRYLIDEGLI